MAEVQGPEVSSSADTGAQKSSNAVEWKSTADSAPNPISAALSKESIVPQRSQAVQDQPTSSEDPHSKGERRSLLACCCCERCCTTHVGSHMLKAAAWVESVKSETF